MIKKAVSLKIEIAASEEGADLYVNTRYYRLDHTQLTSLDDLRQLLRNEPEHVYNAILQLLKEISE